MVFPAVHFEKQTAAGPSPDGRDGKKHGHGVFTSSDNSSPWRQWGCHRWVRRSSELGVGGLGRFGELGLGTRELEYVKALDKSGCSPETSRGVR